MRRVKISILIDTATGWGRRIIRGILDYNLQFGSWEISIEPKGRMEAFELSDPQECDGIIARITHEKMARELHALHVPVLNISSLSVGGPRFPRVSTDYTACAKLAISHFRDNALQNFVYVGPLHLSHVREHEQAFEKALSAAGINCKVFRPSFNLDSTIPREIIDNELIPWLRKLPKPVGLFTWGFQIGREIVNACRQAGISVPNDIAILGGDYDELLSDACQPPLSGIVTPAQQIGYKAASILDDILKGNPPPAHPLLIPPERIEERQSSEIMAIEDPLILKAVRYIRSHACSNISVDDILREVPISRRLLERRFVKVLEHSPAQEIRRVRINHARKLLTATNLSLEDIAQSCGYASYNYLGTVFKKETGVSPGVYRKQNQLSP